MTPIFRVEQRDQMGNLINRSVFFFSKEKAQEYAEAFKEQDTNIYICRYWVKE